MLATMVEFADLALAALVAGAMFGVWISFNPTGLEASSYVALQQHAIRRLNVVMPAMGAATILLTIVAATLSRNDRARLALLLGAAACFMAAALITRFYNQPINAIVITWSAGAPPETWSRLRDAWWGWHVKRTIVGIVGLSLVIAAALNDSAARHLQS